MTSVAWPGAGPAPSRGASTSCTPGGGCLASRALRHGLLLLITGSLTVGTGLSGDPSTAVDRVSLLTAWLCFGLLVATLGLGPWQALRTAQPLINNLLRRDLGIWAALTGLAHLVVATAEVMQPAYFSTYFTVSPGAPLTGWAGWIGRSSIVGGYVVGLIFLVLLGLSNNLSLRRLGSGRWKRLQGLSSVAFLLTVAHGAVFQLIEGRTGVWLATLVVMSIAILALRRRARRAIAAG